MATRQSTIDYLLEQLAELGQVNAKKMFGEYCLYYQDKPVALVCDDQLFVKPLQAVKDFIGEVVEGIPYPGAKTQLLIGGEYWDDAEWLSGLIKICYKNLPEKKAKTKKK